MSRETILVVGATGMLGEPVARRLSVAGYAVRVLTRRPEPARGKFGSEFEIMQGDVEDPASLEAALADCDGVHVSLDGGADPDLERRGTTNVAQAAAKLGVARLTYLSGASVFEENAWFAGTRARFQAEAAIRASGVPYTIFNATWFMESLPRFVHGGRGLVIGRQPHPAHWVAAEDFARMVARAYSSEDAVNKRLFIYGPEAYTLREALTIYCRIAYPGARIITLPIWLARIIARLGKREALQAALPFLTYHQKAHEGGDPAEANALLGAPTTTLAAWSQQQAERSAAEA
ncbi:MAG: NAD(P)H-binding protein [Anaerolineae bacterium]|nr:NAD(P)H-binding protein [Anaerolineae bacterium]